MLKGKPIIGAARQVAALCLAAIIFVMTLLYGADAAQLATTAASPQEAQTYLPMMKDKGQRRFSAPTNC